MAREKTKIKSVHVFLTKEEFDAIEALAFTREYRGNRSNVVRAALQAFPPIAKKLKKKGVDISRNA